VMAAFVMEYPNPRRQRGCGRSMSHCTMPPPRPGVNRQGVARD
jgi:hypothetical protein